MRSLLTFDAETHTYYLDGQRIPGVSEVLRPLADFSAVPPSVLKAAADFGTAVHRACELDDLGELDESTLDEPLRPYVAAWRAFSVAHRVRWDQIEQRVCHEQMRYAGTPDRVGTVDGQPAIVDIKTSAEVYPHFGPQLAAYAHAIGRPTINRLVVRLTGRGTFQTTVMRNPTDWPTFASLLTVRNWCAQHRINPPFMRAAA